MHFSTRATIHAPAQQVWAILTDLAAWPSWNTTVTATEGTIASGAKVKVTVTANPGRAFPVKVKTMTEPSLMVWSGGMPLGLFTGTRTYTLAESAGITEFTMDEVYSGPLAGLITRSIPDLQPSFLEFAQCLKAEAENAASTS